MSAKTLTQHLDPEKGPKKILSLDGGGIRGALTLGFLSRIETIIRQKSNNPEMRLCDYFDLIGGTSTGAIIASALAIGMTVDEIKQKYMQLGGIIFGKKFKWYNPLETMHFLRENYSHKAFETELQNIFGDITMGDERIKTGLCILSKRADTNSLWPLINHPGGRFFDSALGKNKNILLWQAVRASSAAPTYFAPIIIDVGDDVKGAFVDGGLSTANNPALTLLMVATFKGFPFHWSMQEDKLQVVSVGTGYGVRKKITADIDDDTMLNWASNAPDMLMEDTSWQNQTVLQWLSDSPTTQSIDMEIETLKGDYIAGKPVIQYLRYNTEITENSMNGLHLGKTFSAKEINDLLEMSNAENREILYAIGEKVAERKVKTEHFPENFFSAELS